MTFTVNLLVVVTELVVCELTTMYRCELLRSKLFMSCVVLSTSLAGSTVLLFSVVTSVEAITDTSTHICGSMKTFESLNFSTVYSLMADSHRALKELGMIFTFHVRSAREGNVFSLFVHQVVHLGLSSLVLSPGGVPPNRPVARGLRYPQSGLQLGVPPSQAWGQA